MNVRYWVCILIGALSILGAGSAVLNNHPFWAVANIICLWVNLKNAGQCQTRNTSSSPK